MLGILETLSNAPWWSIAALGFSGIALMVATLNYRRKSGIRLRGSFGIASSMSCADKYISRIVLENLKDRAFTIHEIWLRIGHNYYLEVDNFRDKPLILKPFESYQQEYGPIQFYGASGRRLDLNELIDNDKVKKRLVLSTSEGKVVVPRYVKRWSPVALFFRNYMTAVVRPVRTTFKSEAIGGNIRYVLEFVSVSGKTEIIPLHPRDFELRIFRAFNLTEESMQSAETLTAYLEEQRGKGLLLCEKFTVHDTSAWRARVSELYDKEPTVAKRYGFFKYHIRGRLITRRLDRERRRSNREAQRKPARS